MPDAPLQSGVSRRAIDRAAPDIFRYPIFSFVRRGKTKHITGWIRQYLNNEQKRRWDYFFRPDMDLLREIHAGQILKLTESLEQEEADLAHESRLLPQLRRYGPRRLKGLAGTCVAACVVFMGLALSSSGLWFAPAAVAAIGSLLLLAAIPGARTNDRIAERRRQVEAVREVHRQIENQQPEMTLTEADMDALLERALANLVIDEEWRLEIRKEKGGEYHGPEPKTYGPMTRWALATDRKAWLDAAIESEGREYRPPVHWVARRGGHYVRYDVKVIFVHHGQVTQYQGFYDLVQGEWMGVTRRHIMLANLFSVEDETAEDFDFRQTVKARIDRVSKSEKKGGGAGDEAGSESGKAGTRNDGAAEENDPDLISLTQTTVVRFIGSGGSVELNFVASGQKSSLIAELRQREEQELAAAVAAPPDLPGGRGEVDAARSQLELQTQLARLDDAKARVIRTKTIDDVEDLINRILAHTRWAFSERHLEDQRRAK